MSLMHADPQICMHHDVTFTLHSLKQPVALIVSSLRPTPTSDAHWTVLDGIEDILGSHFNTRPRGSPLREWAGSMVWNQAS